MKICPKIQIRINHKQTRQSAWGLREKKNATDPENMFCLTNIKICRGPTITLIWPISPFIWACFLTDRPFTEMNSSHRSTNVFIFLSHFSLQITYRLDSVSSRRALRWIGTRKARHFRDGFAGWVSDFRLLFRRLLAALVRGDVGLRRRAHVPRQDRHHRCRLRPSTRR